MTFTFWNYYVLKLLRLETITFSDATLSDINVVLCYVLSQYRSRLIRTRGMCADQGGCGAWWWAWPSAWQLWVESSSTSTSYWPSFWPSRYTVTKDYFLAPRGKFSYQGLKSLHSIQEHFPHHPIWVVEFIVGPCNSVPQQVNQKSREKISLGKRSRKITCGKSTGKVLPFFLFADVVIHWPYTQTNTPACYTDAERLRV